MEYARKLYFCNFDETQGEFESEILKELWSGHHAELLQNNSLLKHILQTDMTTKSIRDKISKENESEALTLAISAILLFCDHNWTSKSKSTQAISEVIGLDWPASVDASERLQRDSEELDPNTKYPELLLLAEEIFNALNTHNDNLLHLWWNHRCLMTHQRVMDNTCPSLYNHLELLSAKLSNLTQTLLDESSQHILLLAELCQGFLVYGRVQKAEEYLVKAKRVAGLTLELKGVLGKRTKFQQDNLPQLALIATVAESGRPGAHETHGNTRLPREVELRDDVRLHTVAYADDQHRDARLPSLEQMLCLLTVQYLQKAQPKDNLAEEELRPHVEAVVRQTHGAWSVRVAALLLRCRLEASNKHTVERAMTQCEAVVNEGAADNVDTVHRLSYLWASGLAPAWTWRQLLGDLYLSLGLVKAALEEFLTLQLWEDVIVCYTLLQLRHKAAVVIQQQIDIKPTPKLHCLLGDATDDVSCYERAWDLSGHRSARAQRHWGNYLFDRNKYDECIPHYEKSLEINSIQERVWLRLGYAALSTERWETAAAAYRRYTYLQPNTFEAWNNLAKVYVKQGDKPRAHRALMEALRFNYDNWKLWENVITVSLDTGHFEDVLRGAHRVLDITGKFRDVEVLSLLARAVLEDHKDADGHSAARLLKRLLELMGRVTSVHSTDSQLWRLYAEISPTQLLRAQRLQKAYRGYTQESDWSSDPNTCRQVVEFAHALLDASLSAVRDAREQDVLQASAEQSDREQDGLQAGAKQDAREHDVSQAAQQLASARLSAQAVIRAAEKHDWPEVRPALDTLRSKFEQVVQFLKS